MAKRDMGIELKTDVLEVMARFCYFDPDYWSPDRAIGNMLFDPRELVACNGHILARIAMDLNANGSSAFGIRRRDIDVVIGAARATERESIILFDAGDFAEFEIAPHGSTRIRAKKQDVTKFPPVDQLFAKASAGEPPAIYFDPKYLRDVAELVSAVHDYRTGIKVVAWDGLTGPVQFATKQLRIILMPMRGPGGDDV